MGFKGLFLAVKPENRLECGICWWVCDPELDDDGRGIASGTRFAEFPRHGAAPVAVHHGTSSWSSANEALAARIKHDWHFPSGDYEVTVAGEDRLSTYHLCSLSSPAFEFAAHQQACRTVLTRAHALVAEAAKAGRHAFLGRRG